LGINGIDTKDEAGLITLIKETEHSSMLISEFDRHLHARTNLAETTMKSYIEIIKSLSQKSNLLEIDAIWIEDNIILNKSIKQSTRRMRIFALRQFFVFCMWTKRRDDNPAKAVLPPKIPRAIHRNLRPEIMERIFRGLQDSRERVIIGLLYFCGLRAKELLGITTDDIDFIAHRIRVDGKGGVERFVPYQLDNAFTDLLIRYKTEYKIKKYFIATLDGEQMAYQTLREIIDNIGARINYHFTAHQLRHTCASELWKRGMDPMALMTFLGHKNIATTLRYVEIDFNTVQEKYNKIRLIKNFT
jgi:site-specific recombinase XerD